MGLEVIGAGFGRTGTMSLKLALEQLGFGPCYHMSEVFKNPRAPEYWAAAAEGKSVEWDVVFDGYRSAVDWPSADYWRELATHYPEAKVILTVRDPESWYRSTQDTIFGPANILMSSDSAIGRTMRAITRHFGGDPHDRSACLVGYAAHNDKVRRDLPAERLLVLDMSEGWKPLCDFLKVPVPATPFPRANSTDEWLERASARMAAAASAATGPASH